MFRSDGRQCVYRRRGERFADACVLQRDRFGGGSLLVWGSIAYNFKSELVFIDGSLTALKYRDNVLVPHVIPAIRQRALTFQQDNARPHVAHICTDLLTENDIDVMDWPPYSPDLSPIEHLWDELDRRVRRRRNVPQTLGQMRQALQEEWNNIPLAKINKLIDSMTSRVRSAIAVRGGHTRY